MIPIQDSEEVVAQEGEDCYLLILTQDSEEVVAQEGEAWSVGEYDHPKVWVCHYHAGGCGTSQGVMGGDDPPTVR